MIGVLLKGLERQETTYEHFSCAKLLSARAKCMNGNQA